MTKKQGLNSKFCNKCGNIIKGNLRSSQEVWYICSDCVQGGVEYVENHPQKFPEAHLSKAERQKRIRAARKAKRRRVERW